MNYRHAFHAGNFADVHKHVVFLLLLEHLHKKPAPFFVLDTHAGRGLYDLRSADAQRGDEWKQGIARLQSAKPAAPELQRYLAFMDSAALTYSGSPLLAAAMLRESDRAVFVERQPEEATALRSALGRRKRIAVLVEDGYNALKSQLPPKENRGLVLIDPPYESESELADATRALQLSLGRWPSGINCLWYPLKPGAVEQRLYRGLVDGGLKKLLIATLSIRPSDSPLGLNGSGLLIANPPWQFEERLRALLPALHRTLAPDGAGGVRVDWLARE